MTYDLPTLPSPSAYDVAEKSRETMEWLRSNIAVGYTSERGPAWWASGAATKDGTWTGIPDGSHFDGPVPQWRVDEILASGALVEGAVTVTLPDGTVIADESRKGIVRKSTGRVLYTPKQSYAVHQYAETLDGFLKRLAHENIPCSSVGLLQQGAVAFIQGRLPESHEVAGYGYVPYIGVVTSADGSLATTPHTGVLGEVCDNTVRNGLAGALTKFKIRHTSGSKPRVQEAREKLGIRLVQVAESFEEVVSGLVSIDVTDQDFRLWLDEMAPVKDQDGKVKAGRSLTIAENKRDTLTRLWTKDEKVAPWAGTAFGSCLASPWDRGKLPYPRGRVRQRLRERAGGPAVLLLLRRGAAQSGICHARCSGGAGFGFSVCVRFGLLAQASARGRGRRRRRDLPSPRQVTSAQGVITHTQTQTTRNSQTRSKEDRHDSSSSCQGSVSRRSAGRRTQWLGTTEHLHGGTRQHPVGHRCQQRCLAEPDRGGQSADHRSQCDHRGRDGEPRQRIGQRVTFYQRRPRRNHW